MVCFHPRSFASRYYEDLYSLVNFLPRSIMPSGIPPPSMEYDQSIPRNRHISRSSIRNASDDQGNDLSDLPAELHNRSASSGATSSHSTDGLHPRILPDLTPQFINHPPQTLRPARCPPDHRWIWQRDSLRSRARRAEQGAMAELRIKEREFMNMKNIPLDVTMFMSSWIATLQKRKAIDVPTTSE